jgi:hypothetical protein
MFDGLVIAVGSDPVGGQYLSGSVEPIETICWQSEPPTADVQRFPTMMIHLGYNGLRRALPLQIRFALIVPRE